MTSPKPDNAAAANAGAATPRGEVRTAKVTLCGESFQLRTDQTQEALERLAGYVNAKARAAGAGDAPSPENFRLLALASLGIAAELFEAQGKIEENERQDRDLLAKAKSLNASLDRALARRD